MTLKMKARASNVYIFHCQQKLVAQNTQDRCRRIQNQKNIVI